jgi:5-methylcytosine-specific restriction endonuclease McrA
MPYIPTTTKYKWIRKIKKDYNKSYSDPKYAKLYNSTRWRSLRKQHIISNPLCVVCKKNNKVKEAAVVDHIIEIADGGKMFDPSNLQSLCDPHHRSKTSIAVHRRKKKDNK